MFYGYVSSLNCISIVLLLQSLTEGGGRHLIASVGDDDAVTVSEIEIITAESTGSPVVTLIRQCSENSAHSSSITGTFSNNYTLFRRFLCDLEDPWALCRI